MSLYCVTGTVEDKEEDDVNHGFLHLTRRFNPSSSTYLTLDEVATLVLRLELRLEHGGFAMELLVVFSRERFFFEFNSLLFS